MSINKIYGLNRIIDTKYEMYKNKLLYMGLKNAKPIIRTSWALNKLPSINKKWLLEMKNRARIIQYTNIAQENLKMINRIKKSKSTYDVDKYNRDYALNKKYSNNIRRCKNFSVTKSNTMYKLYLNNNNSAFNFYKKESFSN